MATRNVQDSPAAQLSESNPPMQNARMAATDNWAEQTASCVAPFLTLDLRGGRDGGKIEVGGGSRREGGGKDGSRSQNIAWHLRRACGWKDWNMEGRSMVENLLFSKRALRRGVMNVVAKLVDGVRCWEEKAYRELGGRERQSMGWKGVEVEGGRGYNMAERKAVEGISERRGNEERKTSLHYPSDSKCAHLFAPLTFPFHRREQGALSSIHLLPLGITHGGTNPAHSAGRPEIANGDL
ncbi:hypothetical protein B0H14DRAFT_3172668 [Mycena olivaceomarginata]|nr:hypothetical protein B0H14DRAFT_3172668 [Mycena olivaceomarginata]